ncbi:acetolactate synthase 3 large subunit [Oceanibacterium hippocampi]|uniref:Acetolactate synthase n=1 Tax=Oceanibacterium hippocampi TaxID=745714 RepID=A0A1Y5TWW5_9PROT|nr:acetolactate synthase 3 large subunit [Oceanibacterium hippocampi]SLN72411.1 Acetolactate synthase isozyme 3 large subunit [Oceanibacterium hippocampi]
MSSKMMTGAEIILQALADQGVEVVFGYPGGAVLPIYDELFRQSNRIRHVLSRQEGGSVHAAEGYARSTGKPGVVLVTSGPGATNAVTGLTDALMDSVPLVCLTGQVATHMIGNDAFQEADTVGITRPCTKHNYLVKDINDLGRVMHEAFYVATHGRPGPVVVDLPKDIQLASAPYKSPVKFAHPSYKPQVKGDQQAIRKAVEMIAKAERPIFYCGGGVINSGENAVKLVTEFVRMTGFPITNTLMGLGGFPGTDPQCLGMLGMHGTFEANNAMHDCDVMIAIGARFDDRVTGRLDAFSPKSKKIQIDIDPSSINKNVAVDLPIIGDVGHIMEDMMKIWRTSARQPNKEALAKWWTRIGKWRDRNCLAYRQDDKVIKPQYALERLYELTKSRNPYITTEVGQHQMWAAQFFKFNDPKHWMTSGGLGTMGYGLPAALGVQIAHPDALVIDVAGEASILMNIQEMATLAQYRLPVKIFILNNQYMGMVRQWQELLHGGRYSESYSESLPDFVKLAESFGAAGLRCTNPGDVDDCIKEMIAIDKAVIVDMVVDQTENCFPMVPSGAAHNEMILGDDKEADKPRVSDQGFALV